MRIDAGPRLAQAVVAGSCAFLVRQVAADPPRDGPDQSRRRLERIDERLAGQAATSTPS